MKTMTFGEFRRLCFCNSEKLTGRVFVIDGTPYEWVGIGIVEVDEYDPEKAIEVVE